MEMRGGDDDNGIEAIASMTNTEKGKRHRKGRAQSHGSKALRARTAGLPGSGRESLPAWGGSRL